MWDDLITCCIFFSSYIQCYNSLIQRKKEQQVAECAKLFSEISGDLFRQDVGCSRVQAIFTDGRTANRLTK
jgi:hypothetical protein